MWLLFLLIGLLSVAAVGYVIWPLFQRSSVAPPPEGEELAELLTRKDSTLQAIRDLEFDFSVGKMEEADFERFNLILRRRALALIQQIDHFAPQTVQLENALEEEIADLRRVEESFRHESRGRLREE